MEKGLNKPVSRKELFSRYGSRPSYSIIEISIRWSLRFLSYLTIFITIAVIVVLLKDALVFFQKASLTEFLFSTKWEPFGEPKHFGIWPLLTGTLMIAMGACSLAIPMGLGTAIYLTQYASEKTREIVGPIIEILGGIPTVVYGYFALSAVTPLLRIFFPGIEVFNAMSASIVVGIAIIPMVSSLSADSIRLVPSSLSHAGYALGMRKLHVIIKIIIPAAMSGIISSFILAFARSIGETMIVTLAAGATPNMSLNYLKGIQTITAYIVQISLGDTPAGSIEYYTIYVLGLTLFLLTFAFNYLASRIVKRFREAYN